jgi:hypothetical protein
VVMSPQRSCTDPMAPGAHSLDDPGGSRCGVRIGRCVLAETRSEPRGTRTVSYGGGAGGRLERHVLSLGRAGRADAQVHERSCRDQQYQRAAERDPAERAEERDLGCGADASGRPDLNRGPHRPERCALPGCATPRAAVQSTALVRALRGAARRSRRRPCPGRHRPRRRRAPGRCRSHPGPRRSCPGPCPSCSGRCPSLRRPPGR